MDQRERTARLATPCPPVFYNSPRPRIRSVSAIVSCVASPLRCGVALPILSLRLLNVPERIVLPGVEQEQPVDGAEHEMIRAFQIFSREPVPEMFAGSCEFVETAIERVAVFLRVEHEHGESPILSWRQTNEGNGHEPFYCASAG